MSKNDIQFRIDQYRDIEQLLETMRQVHGEPVPTTVPPDISEMDPAKVVPDGPAHRQLPVDVSKQYTDNLAHNIQPETFGRKSDGTPTVVKVFESPGDSLPTGQKSGVQPSRKTKGRERTEKSESEIPSWVQHEQRYEEMVNAVEACGESGRKLPTTGAVAELEEHMGRESVPQEQQYFDATVEPDPKVVSGGAEVRDENWDPDRQVTKTIHSSKIV